jgi:hypothetical protein
VIAWWRGMCDGAHCGFELALLRFCLSATISQCGCIALQMRERLNCHSVSKCREKVVGIALTEVPWEISWAVSLW